MFMSFISELSYFVFYVCRTNEFYGDIGIFYYLLINNKFYVNLLPLSYHAFVTVLRVQTYRLTKFRVPSATIFSWDSNS